MSYYSFETQKSCQASVFRENNTKYQLAEWQPLRRARMTAFLGLWDKFPRSILANARAGLGIGSEAYLHELDLLRAAGDAAVTLYRYIAHRL